jgi:DNA-binding transcriptional LysR family regulator
MIRRMELTQRLLEQFLAVADEGHIGRAARRLSMTQPPLTQAMQRLERAVGVKLFDRTTRGVELTAAGRSFHADAERLSSAHGAAIRRTQRVAAGLQGVIHVGFVVSLAYRFIPDLLRAGAGALPDLSLHLVQTRSRQTVHAVQSGQIDVAFARGPLHDADGLIVTEVAREDTVLAVPSRHRLAEKPVVTLADLRDEPIVVPSPQTLAGLSAQIHAALRDAGITPRIAAHTDELFAMMSYPIAGLAAAFVPAQIAAMHHPQVTYVPLSDDHSRLATSIVAVFRPKADPAVTRLLDLVSDAPFEYRG